MLHEEASRLGGHLAAHYQCGGDPEETLLHSFLHGGEEIRRFVLLDLQIRVPQNPERPGTLHEKSRKERVQIFRHHILDPHEGGGIPLREAPRRSGQGLLFLFLHGNEAGKCAGNLEAGETIPSCSS